MLCGSLNGILVEKREKIIRTDVLAGDLLIVIIAKNIFLG